MSLVKCPNCGLMISDEAETCFGCGYQVSVPQTYSVTLTQPEQAFQVGEQELPLNEQIRRMQIADNVIQEVFKFISSADDKKETAGKIAGYGKKNMGCGTIILLVIVGWMVSCVALLYLAAFYIKYPVRTIIVSIILVLAVVFFVVKRELSKSNKIKELRVQEGTDRLHAMEILQNNAQAVAFIPKNYRFPLATGYMREMYESGRVRNMNEALDKYDEYEHRLKMEMSQSAILEQMEFQQSQISGASAAATVGAAASVINLLTSL